MRNLLLVPALLAATPAMAQTRPTLEAEIRRPVACARPKVEHAMGQAPRVTSLTELPAAYRLHTVERRAAGCPVYPEARKVSDRTGRLTAPRPSAP